MTKLRLSATALQDFEECKMRFLYRYIYGLKPEKEKDSQRIGEVWHRCHEIIRMLPQGKCPMCFKRGQIKEDCYLCDGTSVLPEDLMEAVTRYINFQYSDVPENKTAEEWEDERIKILYSFIGYRWYFGQSRFDTVASEVWFDNPIINPSTRKELHSAHIVGKIDHILWDSETGLYYNGERKSTNKALDDSSYWNRLELDIQVSTYLYEARVAQLSGALQEYGISPDDPLIHSTWYDVWHKPSIEPKFLTQKDTKEFLETGKYFDEQFKVKHSVYGATGQDDETTVNDVLALIKPGKRGFAICETPEMYGARLIADIGERPEFYFAQREIARDDKQMEQFEADLYRRTRAIQAYQNNDLWTCNDRSCTTPFHCDFRGICQNHVAVGPVDIPEGYVKGR